MAGLVFGCFSLSVCSQNCLQLLISFTCRNCLHFNSWIGMIKSHPYFENSKILCTSGSYIAFTMGVSKCLAMFQGLQWEGDAHFSHCDERSSYSCLTVLVLSPALRWMVWPGCSEEGNPAKQAVWPQLTYRIQSLVCPKPSALPVVRKFLLKPIWGYQFIWCSGTSQQCPGLIQFTSRTVISGLERLGIYSIPVHDQWYPEQPCFAVLCLGELCPAAVDWQLFWDLGVTIDTTSSGTEPESPKEIRKDDLESNWSPGSCPLGSTGSSPTKGLYLSRGGPVTLWVCQQNPFSLPAVFCVGTPANGLLKGLGSLFELLVLFCEEDSVGDTTKRMKALMWEWFFLTDVAWMFSHFTSLKNRRF